MYYRFVPNTISGAPKLQCNVYPLINHQKLTRKPPTLWIKVELKRMADCYLILHSNVETKS